MNSLFLGRTDKHLAADRIPSNIEEYIFVSEALRVVLEDLGPQVSQSVFGIVGILVMICGLECGLALKCQYRTKYLPGAAQAAQTDARVQAQHSVLRAYWMVDLSVSGHGQLQCI